MHVRPGGGQPSWRANCSSRGGAVLEHWVAALLLLVEDIAGSCCGRGQAHSSSGSTGQQLVTVSAAVHVSSHGLALVAPPICQYLDLVPCTLHMYTTGSCTCRPCCWLHLSCSAQAALVVAEADAAAILSQLATQLLQQWQHLLAVLQPAVAAAMQQEQQQEGRQQDQGKGGQQDQAAARPAPPPLNEAAAAASSSSCANGGEAMDAPPRSTAASSTSSKSRGKGGKPQALKQQQHQLSEEQCQALGHLVGAMLGAWQPGLDAPTWLQQQQGHQQQQQQADEPPMQEPVKRPQQQQTQRRAPISCGEVQGAVCQVVQAARLPALLLQEVVQQGSQQVGQGGEGGGHLLLVRMLIMHVLLQLMEWCCASFLQSIEPLLTSARHSFGRFALLPGPRRAPACTCCCMWCATRPAPPSFCCAPMRLAWSRRVSLPWTAATIFTQTSTRRTPSMLAWIGCCR